MDLGTLVVAVVAGLGSGVFGAWLTARTQSNLARENREHEAVVALLGYQRVLHDYEAELDALNWDEEADDWTAEAKAGNWEQGPAWGSIHDARVAAWPYKGWLGRDAEHSIEQGSIWVTPPTDINEAMEELWVRTQQLSKGIQSKFPKYAPPAIDRKGRKRS